MKSWIVRLGGLTIVVALLLFAARLPEEEDHRPSRRPDRIVLTWAGDPATTQAVTWRTSTVVEKAVAQIAVATDGPEMVKSAETLPAQSTLFKSDISEAAYHSVQFSGLQPDRLYAYRVGDGDTWSEWNQFRTASDKPGPLTFVYFGDAQTEIFSLWSRVVRTGFTFAPNAKFLLHAGDLVNVGTRDSLWGEWHRAPGWLNASIPLVPTPGNHEYSGGQKRLTDHWRNQFTLPENGVAGLEESCYYFDIQGTRVISLNSNEKRAEQAPWLEKVLAGNPGKWTVITFHHPVFSAARNRDNKELREAWQPIFDKHKVDIVLTGHDHTYARTNLVSGINMRSEKSGTVYVVSVSGPKMYKLDREPWMERAAENTQLFQVITIDGARLRFESRTATGSLYDAFELRKRPGKPNELINSVPKTPERRSS